VCPCVPVCGRVRSCACACAYVRARVLVRVCLCACACACVRVLVCACVRVCSRLTRQGSADSALADANRTESASSGGTVRCQTPLRARPAQSRSLWRPCDEWGPWLAGVTAPCDEWGPWLAGVTAPPSRCGRGVDASPSRCLRFALPSAFRLGLGGRAPALGGRALAFTGLEPWAAVLLSLLRHHRHANLFAIIVTHSMMSDHGACCSTR